MCFPACEWEKTPLSARGAWSRTTFPQMSLSRGIRQKLVGVKLRGNYANADDLTIVFKFEITPRDISGYAITLERTEYTYTASEITPKIVSVTDGVLPIGSGDYLVAYEAAGGGEADRINVGTAVLKVTANGGNWTGSTSVLFEITPRQLNADEFSYSVNGDKSFCLLNGTEISGYPLGEVTVMFGDVRVPAAAEWQGVGADGMVRADDEISILITASGNFDGTYTFRNEQLTVYSATVTANGGEPRYFVFAAQTSSYAAFLCAHVREI